MKTVALIQARMGSSRLPCKMMLSLHGLPVIDWVVRRAGVSSLLDSLVVAVPDTPLDDILAEHLEAQGVAVFRGPENDVLLRFLLAARAVSATHVVRVCADNPLIWGGEIDALIRYFRILPEQKKAYAYNHIPRNNSYPDGLGAEMISYDLLAFLEQNASRPEHREHCLSYIWDNPRDFHISTFEPENPLLHRPEIKLDLDTPEDYRRLARMDIHPGMTPEEVMRRNFAG